MKNPKKILGSLGRRYGGRPFRIFRNLCYDTIALPAKVKELYDIRRKKYPAQSEAGCFYDKYYQEGRSRNPKRGIICMYDGRIVHGGLTDRLRGILTTYREAKKRGIPFYIYWNSPFELSDYLEPNTVDWRIDSSEISYLKGDTFPVIIQDRTLFENSQLLKQALHNAKTQIHVYSNADNATGEYAGLYKELFRPSEALRREIEYHLDKLGTNYYAFAFRFQGLFGDFTDFQNIILENADRNNFIDRVIDEFKSQTAALPHKAKILVTADSRAFLDTIATTDSRIYIVPGNVRHIDLEKGEYADAWMKTFIDQQLLMHARHVTLMLTGKMYNSGFPRFAAETGNVPYEIHRF